MVVMMMEMMAPIATIDVKLGPNATINIGPSATFGMELRTTKYGSNIFETKGDHHRIAARNVPKMVPRIKPNTVSDNVKLKSINNVPS